MLFVKRWLLCFAVAIFVFLSFASAIGITRINNSDTSITINVTSASNLYAYEVAFDYSGTPSSPTFASFLGAGTTSGYSTRGSVLTVYESKQDGTNTGVTGSGGLFTLTFTGTVTLRYLLAVYGDGSSEYVYYNSSAQSTTTSSSSSGGGGGGGGTSTVQKIDPATVKISSDTPELAISTVAGQPFLRSIKLKNSGTFKVTLDVTYTGFKDLDIPTTITLAPGEEKNFSLSFGAVDKGLITGVISFSVQGNKVYDLPIVVNTKSENFLFDSLMKIAGDPKKISPGGKMKVQINLEQVAKQNEKVDVVASYVIKDFYGNSYLEEKETFSVLTAKDYDKEFDIPKDLKPGKYVLGLEVTYPGAFATASAQFEVPEPFWSLNSNTFLIVIGIVVLLLIAGVIYWAIMRRKAFYPKRSK